MEPRLPFQRGYLKEGSSELQVGGEALGWPGRCFPSRCSTAGR